MKFHLRTKMWSLWHKCVPKKNNAPMKLCPEYYKFHLKSTDFFFVWGNLFFNSFGLRRVGGWHKRKRMPSCMDVLGSLQLNSIKLMMEVMTTLCHSRSSNCKWGAADKVMEFKMFSWGTSLLFSIYVYKFISVLSHLVLLALTLKKHQLNVKISQKNGKNKKKAVDGCVK